MSDQDNEAMRKGVGNGDATWAEAGDGAPGATPQGGEAPESKGGAIGSIPQQVKEQTDKVINIASKQASTIAGQAASTADAGIGKAAGGLGTLAGTIRDKSQSLGDGQAQSIATSAAGKLESGAEKLRDQNTGQLLGQLAALVRRRPIGSLLLAVGIGWLLARTLR